MQWTIWNNNRFKAWCFLTLAIICEIIGTTFMAEAVRFDNLWGYGVMAVALVFSYYFLALSVQTIHVGIAYAIWEGVGLILLIIVAMLVFNEYPTFQEVIGIGLALCGITLVTMGEEH